MYKTRNTVTGNRIRGTWEMGGMSSNIPGNVTKHSGECPQTFRGMLPTFRGMLPNILGNVAKLFRGMSVLLKEMKTQAQSKISSFFCVWCKPRELGGRGSTRFPCVTPVVKSFPSNLLWAIVSYWAKSHLESCQTSTMELFCENSHRP